jgi:hypothetical protein
MSAPQLLFFFWIGASALLAENACATPPTARREDREAEREIEPPFVPRGHACLSVVDPGRLRPPEVLING